MSEPDDPRASQCGCGAPRLRDLNELRLAPIEGVRYCLFGCCPPGQGRPSRTTPEVHTP